MSTLETYPLKAIGANFKIVAASETNEDYRNFFLSNHPGRFEHVYESLDFQLNGEPCLLCLEGEISCPPTGREGDQETHLMICGSPCDPFSMQRAKRFSTGSVKNHSDFATTMEGVTKAYTTYEPIVGVMEQVSGFLLPFEAGGTDTPFSRPGQIHNIYLSF